MNASKTLLMSVCLLTIPVWGASAGIVVVGQDKPMAGGGEPSKTVISIEGHYLRMDANMGGGSQVIIFDGGQSVMKMMDPARKTYREMTRQDVERMSSQISDVMAQMQQKMKDLPPAQREMMEKMMKGKMGGMATTAASKTVYKKVSSGQKVGQWTCDVYEGSRDGQKQVEVCAADWKTIGLGADDFQVLQQMGEFFKGLMPANAEDMFSVGSANWEQQQGFPGIPVRRVSYQAGQAQREFVLTEVRHESLASSLFQVPAGYTKEEMPAMRAPR